MLIIENFFSSLEGAYAPNTVRSYRSDFEHYATWCQKYQYDPLDTLEDKFADYILEMGESLTVATIQRRVASLSSIFNLTKSRNSTKEPVVILTFKKLRRKFGKPQKQATPLTYDIFLLPKAYFWIKHQYTIDIKQQHPISPMSYCNR